MIIKLPTHFAILTILILLPGLQPARSGQNDLPDSAYISGLVGHPQRYNLSCESRSAADWAAFWDVEIDESEFLFALPASDNPDLGFVGNPNDAWGNLPPLSYGVHAGPVADVLQEYGLQAEARHHLEWDELREDIAAERPVIVWIIGQMWAGAPVSYTGSNGDTAKVARYEHTMILIGYDPDVVYLVDAYSGWTVIYSLPAFLASWSVLGNMAVTGEGPEDEPEPPPAPPPVDPAKYPYQIRLPLVFENSAGKTAGEEKEESPEENDPETYVVQRGDYLIALAEEFGVDWLELAERNEIRYPYVIYPGQVLRIRDK